MKKSILLLLFLAAMVTSTIAQSENPALFVIDLLKTKTRMKTENGEFGAWKNQGKSDLTIGIYQELNGDGKNIIRFLHMKKKLLVKTYKYTDSDTEIKEDTQFMTFTGTDNYSDPVKVIVSYYPSSASMSTAEWLKVTIVHDKYESEYEAAYVKN